MTNPKNQLSAVARFYSQNVELGSLLPTGVPEWRRCWLVELTSTGSPMTVTVSAGDIAHTDRPSGHPSAMLLRVPSGFSDADVDLAVFVLAEGLRSRRLPAATVPSQDDVDGKRWRDRVDPVLLAHAYAWRLGHLETVLAAHEAACADFQVIEHARFLVCEAAEALDFHLSWHGIDGF